VETQTVMSLVKACTIDQLKPGEALRLNLTPLIAVYRLDDGFYATEDTCSHAQASLSAGDIDLEECTVECPYHASLFEIRTGRVLSLPANRPLKTYPVKVEGNDVFVCKD
jgi:3-phenylpropionate/trans-cinnamate dioxygenase ferredoxin subunit